MPINPSEVKVGTEVVNDHTGEKAKVVGLTVIPNPGSYEPFVDVQFEQEVARTEVLHAGMGDFSHNWSPV